MGALFSRSRQDKSSKPRTLINQKDKAVYDLKVQRDRLQKFQLKNDALMSREYEMARELLKKGQKDKAMLLLRKKKYHQSLIEKTYAKLENIDEMVNSIRFAEMQAEVFDALKEGNETLKEINSQISIDDVEKLMDETSEAVAYQNEISELLSTELTVSDDEAVLKELEAIEEEEAAAVAVELPAAPVEAAPAQDETTEQVAEEHSSHETQTIAEEALALA